jgi:hypothetical protein
MPFGGEDRPLLSAGVDVGGGAIELGLLSVSWGDVIIPLIPSAVGRSFIDVSKAGAVWARYLGVNGSDDDGGDIYDGSMSVGKVWLRGRL